MWKVKGRSINGAVRGNKARIGIVFAEKQVLFFSRREVLALLRLSFGAARNATGSGGALYRCWALSLSQAAVT